MASDLPGTGSVTALPGAGRSDGSPVAEPLLDDLLCDTLPAVTTRSEASDDRISTALVEHREHRIAWYGDLVGPLRVPASATETLVEALLSSDHGLPIVLVPNAPDASALPGSAADDVLVDLRIARSQLFDNHRIELAGLELPFAAADSVADRARLTLHAIDFTVPAWFRVPAGPGWEPAFDVLAQDGAESVSLELPRPASLDVFTEVAGVLRALVDRELPYAVASGITGLVSTFEGFGLLNLLCATGAAVNGAPAAELALILAEPTPDPLAAAARRMSDADAAIVRAFLTTASCPSIRDLVEALEDEGLITPDAA